jgi:uncharacterized damage-inducible protein DinB
MNGQIQALHDYVTAAHEETWAVLTHLANEDFHKHVYSTGDVEWSVRDVLAHMADAERGLLGQIRRLLVGEPTVPDDFDLNRWNRSAVRKRAGQSPQEILGDLEQAHQNILAALSQVDPALLDRVGRHPSGKLLTVDGYFRRIADHRREHTADIQRAALTQDQGGPE